MHTGVHATDDLHLVRLDEVTLYDAGLGDLEHPLDVRVAPDRAVDPHPPGGLQIAGQGGAPVDIGKNGSLAGVGSGFLFLLRRIIFAP